MRILFKRANTLYWKKCLKMTRQLKKSGLVAENKGNHFLVRRINGSKEVKFLTAEKLYRYLLSHSKNFDELAYHLI
jgi:hypothetical protein